MSRAPTSPWIPFLVPLVLLGAVALAATIVALEPDSVLTWVGLGGGGLVLLWLMASTFWPARAERTCPECGAEALERMDPATTMGLRCSQCSYEDPTVSGWFLAEEEEQHLDALVQQQRAAAREAKR